MKSPSTRGSAALCAAALLLCAGAEAQTVTGPLDLTAKVADIHNPGGTAFSDSQVVFPATPDPKLSAEYLYLPPMGINASGHSTSISSAFASALAESDGNGGVGVSSWIAISAVPGSPATDSLVAQAIWGQTMAYGGADAASIRFHFEIPALMVGLIGVAPNRDAVSKTESAQTLVQLTSVITHTDGTQVQGGSFEYGMRVDEYQILLGPATYANFADITLTNDIFNNELTYNGDAYNPEWTLSAVKGDVALGTLEYGDSITYQYTLTATGSTLGGEHGYYAFIGDPFGVDVVTGNLVLTTAPVPEPQDWALMAFGLVGIGWRLRFRR
jgi:hypothetical protein